MFLVTIEAVNPATRSFNKHIVSNTQRVNQRSLIDASSRQLPFSDRPVWAIELFTLPGFGFGRDLSNHLFVDFYA
jgi:hypothetical protein